ncbi:MAG: hypothetical protein ABSD71_08750 [Bacteroidales bacterium]|jgi:hypothetical protein
MISRKTGSRELLFFVILFLLGCLLTLMANQNRGILNNDSEIWADGAGYYCYLPSTFFYHFDARKAPQGIDEKTGYGFEIDHNTNRISTQYFYGVSLLISPFFLIGHIVSLATGQDELGGFSLIYNKIFDIAGVFYLVLGLFFLKKFLRNYFKEYLQYILVLVVFLGTNLFFYSIIDSLMSHLYSFVAISLFLYAMTEFLKDTSRYRYYLLMSIAYGLMIIIRPTNCLIAILFPFWDAIDGKEVISRIKLILKPKYLFIILGIILIMFIPQIFFWKKMYGSFIHLQYGVGFSNWNHPKMIEVWFSTLNGLIPWSPVNLFFISGMFFMIFRKFKNGLLILIFFLLISYIPASYKFWYLGCGYGHRAFIEYLPVLCIPFGFLAKKIIESRRKILKISFFVLVIIMTAFNFSLSLMASRCNFGSTWDWDYYKKQLKRIYLVPGSKLPYTFRNDFENELINNRNVLTNTASNSGSWSAVLDKDHETGCEYSVIVRDFKGEIPKSIQVDLMVKKNNQGPLDAWLVCSCQKDTTIFAKEQQPLETGYMNCTSWVSVIKTFMLPRGLTPETKINIYIWNKGKKDFLIDDMKIRFEEGF